MTDLTPEQIEALAERIEQLTPADILDAAKAIAADDDWGCEYCRNDGRLNANNACPKCDAQYPDEVQHD